MNTTIGREERTWGMLCHLGAFAGFIIPFGNLIVPLVIWLMKKEDMPFVADQGREALNFQITLSIGVLISILLMVVVIGVFLLWLLAIYAVVMLIIASIRANDGVAYRYPFTLRLIR